MADEPCRSWRCRPARSGAAVFQSGTHLYLIGGQVDGEASAEVLVTEATTDAEGSLTGNLTPWSEGPALPEPRADAALGVYVGIPYVLGGVDASGSPRTRSYKGVVEDGELIGWELADGSDGTDELTLPQPLSGAAVVPGTSGFVLLGGRGADGEPTDGVHVAWVDEVSSSGRLLAWQPLEGLALPEPRADSVAAGVGDFIYLVGGEGPDGATDSVFRLELVDREPATNEVGEPLGWAVAAAESALPEARTDAIGFVAGRRGLRHGRLRCRGCPAAERLLGGARHDDRRPARRLAAPRPDGPPGRHGRCADRGRGLHGLHHRRRCARTVRPMGRCGPASRRARRSSSSASPARPSRPSPSRARSASSSATSMAAGAATMNFVILVILGIALSRPESSRRLIARLSRGRLKVPPEEEYGP